MGGKKFTSESGKAAGEKSKRRPSLKKALIEMLEREQKTNGKLSPDNIVKMMATQGIEGNSAILKLMFEYVDGKVKEEVKVEHSATQEMLEVIKGAYKKRNSEEEK